MSLSVKLEVRGMGIRPTEVFLGKGVLKMSSRFTGEHLCRSVISIKLLPRNFIESTLRHGFSRVNLLHIFRIAFPKNSSGGLLLGYALTLFFSKIFYQTTFNLTHEKLANYD